MLRENIKKKIILEIQIFYKKIYKLLVCGESLLVNEKIILIAVLDEN